ncbi:MAG: type II secretion system F family protein [Geobacteraceae bacterium]|nr:type II secretion system F family protein [Geobacteraceae bacterium]
MPVYICKLGTSDGRILSREYEGTGSSTLRKRLEEQGYHVFSVRRRPFSFLRGGPFGRSRVSKRSQLLFNQELLTLIKAGMPILPVIDTILEGSGKGPIADALARIREDIKGGDSLSTALERQGDVFPPLYVASVRAGERTGDLPVTIERYIGYLKKIEGIRKKFVSALFYPCILAVVSVLAVGILLLYVVPILSQVFLDSGAALPLPTRVLITVTSLLRRFFPVVVLLAGAGCIAFRYWSSGETGRPMVHRFLVTAPYFGAILRDYALAGYFRTVANLLGSGVTVVEALRMALGTLGNVYMEGRFAQAIGGIEAGGRLSSALSGTGHLPPMAVRMLGVGESSGALEEMLANISDYLEETLEERLQVLTAAAEPAIMVAMGLVIGLIIVAMYLPIFQLAGAMG